MSADTITVATAPNLWLAKRIYPDHTEQYSLAKHFNFTSFPVSDLADVRRLLDRLILDPRSCVVRGELLNPAENRHVRRLLYLDRDTGEAATFQDLPRRWVALDIENIARPDTLVPADLAGCARLAISHLPTAFHGARCIVQASASHGIKPDLRLRLWFWLDRPTAGDELKCWLAGTPADPAVFGGVQLIFTAGPLFQGGMVDPLPHRLAELPGEVAVAVPSPDLLAPPPAPPPPAEDMRGPLPEPLVESFVSRVLDRVRAAGEGAKHSTLRGAAVSLGGIQARAGFSDGEVTGWLLQAINAPSSRRKDEATIAWGLANGRARPIPIEINPRTASANEKTTPQREATTAAEPRGFLAGQIELTRRPPLTTLPAYYPVPTEALEPALARQRWHIRDTIFAGADLAAARHEAWGRRTAEIAAMGLDGLDLSPGKKGAITRRHIRAVAGERGHEGNRLPLSPRLLVTGAQGSSKTTMASEAVAAITAPIDVWFTQPTLEKAEELARDYRRLTEGRPDALLARIVRGRGAADPEREGHTMCDRAEAARLLADAGLSVRKTLCPSCPFTGICGTHRQAARIAATSHAVFFLASEYLYCPSPAPTPDVLITDDHSAVAAVKISKVPLSALNPFMIPWLGQDTRDTLNTLQAALATSKSPLRDLRAAGTGRAELTKVINAMTKARDKITPAIDGTMPDEAIQAKLDASGRGSINHAIGVIAAVRREITLPRDGLNGVELWRDDIYVSHLRTPRGVKHAAVLALDGTGDAALNRALFGARLEHHRIAIERRANITGTIGKGYSRQSISGIDAKGRPIAGKQASARALRIDIGIIRQAMPGTAAVFSNKATIDALIEEGTVGRDDPVGNFNAVRGLNAWESNRSALVIGQTSMSVRELEHVARAFMAGDAEPFVSMAEPPTAADNWPAKQWPYHATRMRRMADGTLSPVCVAVHPDPRVQPVYEQIREAEVVQAMDRVRPIFNHRDLTPMNNLCLDVTYSVIRTHQELIKGGNSLQRLFNLTGFLPANAADLHRAHPQHFRSERAARRALENYPLPAKSTPLCEWGEVSYRTAGQRGRPSRLIFDGLLVPDPLAELRHRLGELTEYQGKRLERPATEPPNDLRKAAAASSYFASPLAGGATAPHTRPLTHAPP